MDPILHFSELPRDRDGALVGSYRVCDRSSGKLLEEVGDRPIGQGELEQLDAAMGSYIAIAPADADTAEACARAVFERTKDSKRAKLLRAMFKRPRNALRSLDKKEKRSA